MLWSMLWRFECDIETEEGDGEEQLFFVCAMFTAFLNNEIDQLHFPHLFHLKVSDKETDVVPLP